ncbi:MAG TPA: site-specific integrase [Candidatus Ventrousia excrementavium]|uniref:Site-specific integrase n=1 Tax=Candidatus Ventrousia excrementavium TaxID=2840961 RepID=A0A9D1LLR3_9CLOT|nr:site-specific integrase [Candidatus Ventrousia excrementavium]
MAKKRSNGEGSFWQRPDRTWVYQITIGRKADGSPERKSFKGRTKAICKQRKEEWEAQQAALKAKVEADKLEAARIEEEQQRLGHSIESETLFEPAFLEWLRLYKSPPTRKPSTYASYIDTYNIHFAPAFGSLPLYQITQDVIQEYYQKKQLNGARMDGKKGGLSPKTIRNHHMILKDFFTYAIGKYKLPGNPTLSTTRPEVIQKEMRVLSPDEMQIFIEEVMKETQRMAILTDLFVGFRVGELLALQISDLNLQRQTLTVNKNLIRVNTAALSLDNPNIKILNYDPKKKTHLIVQSTPKTKSSNREIAISDGLCELLVRHIFTLSHSSWPNPNNLLFPSKTGTYIDPKSFGIRLSAVSKRCEIKKVNPHALRHTLATRLVEEKTPLNIVQGILGHSSIETTRKYLHKNEDVEREAIGAMTDYLDMEKLSKTPQLNGAKKRAKFAGIILPDFSDQAQSQSPATSR